MPRMHQTTVRFGPDLWAMLEHEAGRLGVSAAQFVRDATIARLEYARGVASAGSGYTQRVERKRVPAQLADELQAPITTTEAVRAQGQLARARAKRLREDADRIRANLVALSR